MNYVTPFMQYIKINYIFKVLQNQFSVFNFNNQIYFHFADFAFIVNDPFQKYKIHVSLYSKILPYSIFSFFLAEKLVFSLTHTVAIYMQF